MRKLVANQNDGNAERKYITPNQIAARWSWHPESVRRALRQRRIESTKVYGRRLVELTEVERIEAEGRIARVE